MGTDLFSLALSFTAMRCWRERAPEVICWEVIIRGQDGVVWWARMGHVLVSLTEEVIRCDGWYGVCE